jgi:hypothetical protein
MCLQARELVPRYGVHHALGCSLSVVVIIIIIVIVVVVIVDVVGGRRRCCCCNGWR